MAKIPYKDKIRNKSLVVRCVKCDKECAWGDSSYKEGMCGDCVGEREEERGRDMYGKR